MKPLQIYSERYGSTGNLGDNINRLLGAPTLDPLQTVIRESVQNIADASVSGHGPEVLIRIRALSPSQRETLRTAVLPVLPEEGRSRQALNAAFTRADAVVLEICDFGTKGLGGPTRPDRVPVGTERTDFVDFLRNVGTARDTHLGGGTYGFGKVSLYRASRCGTIVVDSLPHGSKERRLIGCHIGHSFGIEVDGMLERFTGRHWWGVADPVDHVADPLLGEQAERLASALGLPDRGTCRSGTSIMILDFDTEGDDLKKVGNRIAEVLLWNFWPRLMRDISAEKRLICRIEVDGDEVQLPAPEDIAPFDLLCKAMRATRSRAGSDVRSIASLRPARSLGTLALERGLRAPRRPLVEQGSLVPNVMHHIALMRPVELVVKYLEGTPLPDERFEWVGAFLVDSESEVERAFADAEPPAHDDWIPDYLPKGHAKTFVRVALDRLKTAAADLAMAAHATASGSSAGPPLARLAGRLGAALENVGGEGVGLRRTNGAGAAREGSARKPLRARASRPSFDRLERAERGRIAVFTTQVTQDKRRTGMQLVAHASIAIDGVGTSQVDLEIAQPVVVAIKTVDGRRVSDGSTILLNGEEGLFELHVLVLDECAVTVDAEIQLEARS